MANVLVEETSLSNIASAIRGKNGSTAVYKPGEMAAAITNLPTGGSSGGSSDNEDGLIMDTLVNYENTTATKIKGRCFENSNTLATATFTNVIEVGNRAFSDCYLLSQITLPEATTLGTFCFDNDRKLSTVNCPKVKTVGQSAISWCQSLQSINLPEAEIIEAIAFAYCTVLTKVDLGNCKQFSGTRQFAECKKLTTLILRGNTVCSAVYPVNNNDDGALYNTPIVGNETGGNVYVPRALVDEYKNATNWAVIADRIRAIEDYPEITGG